MNDPLDDRLSRSLHRQASRVPAQSDLTRSALRQAGRIRTRRRVGAVVACLALLAVAVPVGYQLGNGGKANSTEVVTPSTPTASAAPRPSRPAVPKQAVWTIDFDKLTRGPAPATPWVEGRTIHAGEAKRELGANDRLLAVVEAGDVVWAMDPETGTADIVLIRPGGERTILAEGKAGTSRQVSFGGVSADRSRMAWSVSDPGLDDPTKGTSTLTYADTRAGEVINTTEVGAPRDVIGFVKDQVVVANNPHGTWLWEGATDGFVAWKGAETALTTDPASGSVAVSRLPPDQTSETRCSEIVNFTRPTEPDGRTCDDRITTFSPGGQIATTIPAQTDGLGSGTTKVIEPQYNGKELVEVKADLLADVAWESDRAFLVSAYVGSEWAIVRCTVDGSCELATAPQKGAPEETAVYAVQR